MSTGYPCVLRIHHRDELKHGPGNGFLGFIMVRVTDIHSTIQHGFRLSDHLIDHQATEIFYSRARDNWDNTANLIMGGSPRSRVWRFKRECTSLEEIRIYDGDETRLARLDISDLLSKTCVYEVSGFRYDKWRGKIYSFYPEWTRPLPCHEHDAEWANFCLVAGIEKPFVLWWDWEIRGKVYPGIV